MERNTVSFDNMLLPPLKCLNDQPTMRTGRLKLAFHSPVVQGKRKESSSEQFALKMVLLMDKIQRTHWCSEYLNIRKFKAVVSTIPTGAGFCESTLLKFDGKQRYNIIRQIVDRFDSRRHTFEGDFSQLFLCERLRRQQPWFDCKSVNSNRIPWREDCSPGTTFSMVFTFLNGLKLSALREQPSGIKLFVGRLPREVGQGFPTYQTRATFTSIDSGDKGYVSEVGALNTTRFLASKM